MRTLMLVRIAALVAVDAPPVSYLMNLEVASGAGVDADKSRRARRRRADRRHRAGRLSTGNIVAALAVEIEIAELEDQGEG